MAAQLGRPAAPVMAAGQTESEGQTPLVTINCTGSSGSRGGEKGQSAAARPLRGRKRNPRRVQWWPKQAIAAS